MRDKFPGYYRPTDDEFDQLWKEGWFVLDANILLNLYRYQEKARDEFMKVLETLAPRIWVPHQAVLEYQRNRVTTIREQLQKFRDVRKLVNFTTLQNSLTQYNNRLRSLIDPTQFLESVKRPYDAFGAHIAEVEGNQIKVESDESNDPVRGFLDTLLPDRVGPAFTQEELDDLHEEGAARYNRETPPGYVDPAKKGIYEYDWAGCTYKREFGDWILWKQVLNWARERKMQNVVFVTDDRTEDWWEITKDEDGPAKTVGPRPELAAEICAEAGVKLFYMYQPDRLMEWARTKLNLVVANSSIDEIRDVTEREELREASIEFTDQIGTDFDHHAFQFRILVNGESRWCVIAIETVQDFFELSGESLRSTEEWETFRANENIIQAATREAIRNLSIGPDGRIVIGMRELRAVSGRRSHTLSGGMISMPVMYTIDVACEDCDCKKAVHAHKLMPSGAHSVQEEKVCSCQHPWGRHKYVRDTKSKAQRKRDGEI